MKTSATLSATDSSLSEWNHLIDRLVNEVSSWAAERTDWREERHTENRNEKTGLYHFPVLVIHTPKGELTLEPIPRREDGAKVRAYLYAWPTLNRVRLVSDDGVGGWEIITDSGIPLRQPWNRRTFDTLANDLLTAV
ncbi:MAG: hypothetical protein M3Y56_08665 [Armatimonadota bacterium]|nr:hypothetical protein [Armatimonadota bacterium]